jgi:hypothetical protein
MSPSKENFAAAGGKKLFTQPLLLTFTVFVGFLVFEIVK